MRHPEGDAFTKKRNTMELQTHYSKGKAHSRTEPDTNGKAWDIETSKNDRGAVACQAVQITISGGMMSYDIFGAKRYNLASEPGIASAGRVAAVHAKGLVEFERISKDFKPAYEIKIGQVIFTDFQGITRRRAVYEIPRPGSYRTVHLDGSQFETDDHGVKPYTEKFGIGAYYNEGEMISEEEVELLVVKASDTQMQKREAEQAKEKQETADKLRKIAEGAKIISSIPTWAQAIICGHEEQSTCDPMSDYFGSKTTKTVYLSFSSHKKDIFSEMRQAAARCPETAPLSTAGPEVENREKYSMGHGYYLGTDRYSGWQVNKGWIGESTLEKLQIAAAEGRFFCEVTAPAQEAVEVGAPSGGKEATCRLNKAKAGVELYFPGKPSYTVLDDLKRNGFRWGKFNKCWYIHDSPKARLAASKYALVPGEEVINPDGLLVEAEHNARIDSWAQENLG